jgi:hypothetical protein
MNEAAIERLVDRLVEAHRSGMVPIKSIGAYVFARHGRHLNEITGRFFTRILCP